MMEEKPMIEILPNMLLSVNPVMMDATVLTVETYVNPVLKKDTIKIPELTLANPVTLKEEVTVLNVLGMKM